MSTRRKYLELLNLPLNANKDEIRKQFRKLAKEFHPDKNKSENATEIFQLIKEAYDFLMEDKPTPKFIPTEANPSEELKRMERIRKAKERLREKRIQEEKKLKESYQKITSGIQWKLFSMISYVSLFVSILLIVEPLLPNHIEKQLVTHFSTPYNGLFQEEIFLIQTNQNLKIFVERNLENKLQYSDTIYISSSFVFHNPTKIFHKSKLEISQHNIDFSSVNTYPFTSLFFAIPYFVRRKKELTASYIFLFKFSFFVIEGLFLCFLLTQDRWFHLIVFGFL
jgi:curved DNA-binding protein CbpA